MNQGAQISLPGPMFHSPEAAGSQGDSFSLKNYLSRCLVLWDDALVSCKDFIICISLINADWPGARQEV